MNSKENQIVACSQKTNNIFRIQENSFNFYQIHKKNNIKNDKISVSNDNSQISVKFQS